jgi:hypothetical protein
MFRPLFVFLISGSMNVKFRGSRFFGLRFRFAEFRHFVPHLRSSVFGLVLWPGESRIGPFYFTFVSG